jgi:hypothetical protein
LKSAPAAVARICYPTHENTLLGFGSDQTAKEGVKKLAKDGPKFKSNPRLPEIYTKSPVSVNRRCAPNALGSSPTVPFGTVPFSSNENRDSPPPIPSPVFSRIAAVASATNAPPRAV